MRVRSLPITGKPASSQDAAGFDVNAYRMALERYETINRSLLAVRVKPGFVRVKGRLVIRGEFENVPRRFLDLSERSEGYGNVDDRAAEFEPLGIVDGDTLVAWMQGARRPVLRDFRFEFRVSEPGMSAKWMRDKRARDVKKGLCIVCGREPARKGMKTGYFCNARAAERVSRAREAKKARALDESAAIV